MAHQPTAHHGRTARRTLVMLPESTIEDPASRTRCYALVNRLSEPRNVVLLPVRDRRNRINSFVMDIFRTLRLYLLTKRAEDGIILLAQRGTKSRTHVKLLLVWRRVTESKIAFDFDDAVFLQSPKGTRDLVSGADTVIAANEYLAAYARQFSDKVLRVPTAIDLDLYCRPYTTHRNEEPVIGWIGTPWNLEYLRLLRAPLRRLRGSHDFVLTLITDPLGARDLNLPEDIPLRVLPWRLDKFTENLASFDIGVCPLPDTPWTRGKSGYKVLEYMAMRIPPVASPVGELAHIVTHGEDGLLAATEDEWFTSLRTLIDQPELRERIGDAGRRKVEQHFSTEVIARQIEGQLQNLD